MMNKEDLQKESLRLLSATSTRDWNNPSPYIDRRIAAAQVYATLALSMGGEGHEEDHPA